MRRNIFKSVGGLKPPKSVFDLSYEKKFTCDMGELIPVMLDEVVPGDYWKIGNQAVIRFQPLVAPVLHEINVYTHYFFVPYRILWDEWETFITGGVTGDESPAIPVWEPTDTTEGSLWDYCGLPTGVDPDGAYPVDFIRRAYNLVYNEYYRAQELIAEVALTNESILLRAWEKDYFTASLLEQQRGTAPALPISGTTSAVWQSSVFPTSLPTSSINLTAEGNAAGDNKIHVNDAEGASNTLGAFNANTVDLSVASTFDIADLRLAFQIQKWMERNNRAGARYVEFLNAHFGVNPRDDRLQRPEYIGGSKSPVIVSEVLQTSQTTTGVGASPQGNLAGHGISISDSYCGEYHAQEFGLIIGIMSVMPRTAYSQGINRQWLRSTKYDFYFPEFANLSEQAITRAEIYANGVPADNNTIFGYIGRYDEMRTKDSMVCAGMRNTFDYWHLGRQFGAAPQLNQSFVECVPRKDIFAVQDEDGLIVSFANIIKAFRPIPLSSEPGLIDHN